MTTGLNNKNTIVDQSAVQSGRVNYLSDPSQSADFEQTYLAVRQQEGRLYPDDVVQRLPNLPSEHPLYKEWQMRRDSYRKVHTYLTRIKRPLTILDLGCGNGWLSNKLADITDPKVYGLDKNRIELEQAANIFSHKSNLIFFYGDIFEDLFPETRFDIIILASVIQYFPHLQSLLNRLQELLAPRGEIHIFDSPLYTEESASAARQRTIDYYQKMGYPHMANFYFQHRWSELAGFHYQVKYDPSSYVQRIRRRLLKELSSPFPWILINA